MRAGVDVGGGDPGLIVGVEYRLMLHDLLDTGHAQRQYVIGELLKVRLSFATQPNTHVRVDEATVLRMGSFLPRNRSAEKEWSWYGRIGAETVRDASCVRCVAAVLDGGYGASFELGQRLPLLAYFLAEGQFAFAPAFDNFIKLAFGPAIGVRAHLGEGFIIGIQGGYRMQGLTAERHTYRASGELRWALGHDLALRARLERFRSGWESTAGLLAYF